MFGSGLHEITEYESRVRGVTALQMREVALEYFDAERRVEGIVRGVGRTV
jgi:predicted Zn-dependent peptidase